ncbi:MAG: saccharopine dehydrogenase NADP-binding domain-containing protein [Acidobacteria bacterium]|jgi:saccharopine dehydrogenase-like NADP-dependent oxidoreductase|nr:saccharopine dehydrogenase NADP-binding domain-containing protein [Acidobacteriota bacterium]
MRVTVLGAGRVGAAIARDLAKEGEFEVTVADLSPSALEAFEGARGVQTLQVDLSKNEAIAAAVHDAGLVVGAVPGHMGFATAQAVLEAGKPLVDISFFAEDPFELDGLARSKGVVAIVDCGIAPGCGNIILGYLQTMLDKVGRFECLVGGLPVTRTWPFEYKAPFSPSDVLEEYTRPARFVEHGEVVTRPALSEPELIDFPGIGTLEAFNTDGLRTLLKMSQIPFMKERTLRYPGHIEKMRILREIGLFSKTPVPLRGQSVVPLELTSKLLFPMWQLLEGEEDLTIMKIVVEGTRGTSNVRYEYDLLDRYDAETKTLSMARTTGYTCTAAVRLVARGMYKTPGVSPPEFLGRAPGCYLFVMQELAKRGVVFRETVMG